MADTREGRAEVDTDHKLVHFNCRSVTSPPSFQRKAWMTLFERHGLGVLRLLEASREEVRDKVGSGRNGEGRSVCCLNERSY